MMVQNAAFIPDAIPAPAAQSGMARSAAAPGGGVFQQLLQGKEGSAARPAPEKAPKVPSRHVKAEQKPQSTHEEVDGSARNGLPAEAAQTPAAQKAAVAGGKVTPRLAGQQNEAARESEGEAEASGIETASETPVPTAGVEPEKPQAQETVSAGKDQTAATGDAPATQTRPDVTPGLVVAMAAVESNMAARSEGGNAEAGATALARLEALQQRQQQTAMPKSAADADNVQPDQQQQGAITPNQPADAGAKLSQEAGLAKLSREERGAQVVTSKGATEGAQVEKPQAPVARGKAPENEEHSPRLPDAAKPAVAADQAVAASHLSANKTGEGRFVAMPVRNTTADAGGSATTAEPAPSQVGQEKAQVQQVGQEKAQVQQVGQEKAQVQQVAQAQVQVPVEATATATAGADGDAARGAGAGQATLQGKVKLHEEQGSQKEQQAKPVQVSEEEAGQAAEKAPQSREEHYGKAVASKEAREGEPSRQASAAKPSGDEVTGTKSASMATVKPASAEGTVKEMSGAQGEQGQSQQKGEEQQNGQMLGAGVTAQGNSAEVAQAGSRQAGSRSPLHENILSQVREGVVTHDGKGNGQMSIRLNPGELGELKIQLSMENNRLNVQVHADNHMVKDLLMSNLDSLKEALSGKNLTMEGFNVSTGDGGFNGPLNEDRGNQRQQQPSRFARGGGYGGQEPAQVNYLTAEVNNLLDVRF